MVQIAPPPRHTRRDAFRQDYSPFQRFKANIHDVQSTIAFAIFFIVLAINLIYLSHKGVTDPTTLGGDLIGQLSLQGLTNNDTPGRVIDIINALFYILFAQTVLQNVQIFAERRPEARQLGLASTMRGHVIVCGLGRVGYRIVSRLAASGYRVVVIEQDFTGEFVNRTIERGIPVIQGDAREASVQRKAEVRRARAVVACIDGDLINLEIVLAARRANSSAQFILRAFNEDFDEGFERNFGPHTAFSASKLAAPTFAGAALVRNVEHVVTIGGEMLGVAQLTLPANMNAQQVEQTYGVRVLPDSDGKVISVLGALPTLADLNANEAVTGDDSIIICGLGKVGYRVATLLSATYPNRRIVVIHLPEGSGVVAPNTPDPEEARSEIDERVGRSFTKMVAGLPNVDLITGDARDHALLLRAGVERASAVLALTSIDQINVQIGLEARSIRPDVHVVLRVFSGDLALNLGELFKIRTVFSTSDLASPTMAAAAILGGIDGAFAVDDALYAIDERTVTVQDPLVNATVDALRRKQNILVVRVQRGEKVHVLPSLTLGILPGDRVTLVAPVHTLDRLRQSKGRAA